VHGTKGINERRERLTGKTTVDFGVDGSSRFALYRGQTDRQTDASERRTEPGRPAWIMTNEGAVEHRLALRRRALSERRHLHVDVDTQVQLQVRRRIHRKQLPE